MKILAPLCCISLCLVIAPFWLIGAAQMGKERREQRK